MSKHSCKEADCQIYPDATRRRNPKAGEDDASAIIVLIPDGDQYKKEAQYG